MRFRTAFLIVLTALPSLALAEDAALTRREGFMLIWQTIQRPALETRDTYDDMKTGDVGALEVNYARSRGLLDDEVDLFYPDKTMTLEDAVLWLMRTRNVDDADEMELPDLPRLLEKYPVVSSSAGLSDSVSKDELVRLMQEFDKMRNEEVHEISLYSEKFHGKGTAFGETFDMNALTAAHPTFPHNTLVKVTNVENGKSVTVRVNDRGPFVEGRSMDLSLAAFTTIQDRSRGIAMATIQRLGDASLVSACGTGKVRRYQQRIARKVHFTRGVPHTFSTNEELYLAANDAFVVRSIRYPDGTVTKMQDFILKGEAFTFTPIAEGEYVFSFGTTDGRKRDMRMVVTECTEEQ